LLTLLVWLAEKIGFGDVLQLVFVGLLAAAILLPPIGDLLGGSAIAVPVALLVGAGLAALYARATPIRTFVTVISPAPLLFLVLFLFVSPVSELVLPEGGAEAVAGESGSKTPVVMVVFDELPATTPNAFRPSRRSPVTPPGTARRRRSPAARPRPCRRCSPAAGRARATCRSPATILRACSACSRAAIASR
jgi:hypothetical protein